MKTLAYGSIPKDCGTFTFYRQLRAGLEGYGWEVCCVSVGAAEQRLCDPAFVDDGCVALAVAEADLKRQARAFVEWCERRQVDVVMPINSEAMLAALPHLPPTMRVVSRCANAFDHGYRLTVHGRERLARIVVMTPQVANVLQRRFRIPAEQLALIPHGLDRAVFPRRVAPAEGAALELIFVGRLEHNQKGVFYLPPILQQLDRLGVDYHFTIAGAGIHAAALKQRLARPIAAGRVDFVGSVIQPRLFELLVAADILIFPSRFEGFGWALLEGMAAGCVPVASHLAGITDYIVRHGTTGLLCPVGDCGAFAQAIAQLARDRARLRTLSAAVVADVAQRFTLERMASDYAQLLEAVLLAAPPSQPALPWTAFRIPPPLRPSWRSAVPRPLKRLGRELRLRWSEAIQP